MKAIFVVIIIFLSSCSISEGYLITYQVDGEATTAKVLYIDNGFNYEEEIVIPWEKNIFIPNGVQIGLYVYEIIGGEAEARVFFIHNGDLQLYGKKDSVNGQIIIKGVINSTL